MRTACVELERSGRLRLVETHVGNERIVARVAGMTQLLLLLVMCEFHLILIEQAFRVSARALLVMAGLFVILLLAVVHVFSGVVLARVCNRVRHVIADHAAVDHLGDDDSARVTNKRTTLVRIFGNSALGR